MVVTYGLVVDLFVVTFICLVDVALTVVSIMDSEEVNSSAVEECSFATTASFLVGAAAALSPCITCVLSSFISFTTARILGAFKSITGKPNRPAPSLALGQVFVSEKSLSDQPLTNVDLFP